MMGGRVCSGCDRMCQSWYDMGGGYVGDGERSGGVFDGMCMGWHVYGMACISV